MEVLRRQSQGLAYPIAQFRGIRYRVEQTLIYSLHSPFWRHPEASAKSVRALVDHEPPWDVDDFQLAFQFHANFFDFHDQYMEGGTP